MLTPTLPTSPVAAVLSLWALLVVVSAGCGPTDPEIGPAFVEVAQEAGIEFHHQNGASGHYYYVETYGSGAAFLDYDNDGDQDLYAVNSAPLPGFVAEGVPTNAFYRNRGDGTFADATAQTRTGHLGYGMGACVGDIDNDGHVDLYVTNFGPNVLYHNQGDGTFADQTADAGVGDPRLSTSAAFADIDNDGDLDLYVANNVFIDLAYDEGCHQGAVPVYCAPTQYKGESGCSLPQRSGREIRRYYPASRRVQRSRPPVGRRLWRLRRGR